VFVESISNAGMRDSFGIAHIAGKPGEKPGEKPKHGKPSGIGEVCFPFVGPGVMMGEGETDMD